MGKGLTGAVSATAFSGGFAAFYAGMAVKPLRGLIDKFLLPDPGEGPSPEKVESGFFKIYLSARRGGEEVGTTIVSAERDPGYGATACMLAESALCLALQKNELEGEGGVLTPASAMGQTLIARLDAKELSFAIDV